MHHIVRSNHTQFQENAEEPVQLSTLHSMVATRFPGSNISVIATSRPVTDVSKITALQLELAVERDRTAAFELEIDMLKKRVPAESEVQSTAQYQQLLCSEVDSAVCSRDTVERFAEFSMSAVITELQARCPQLYQLVQQLGCTPRNAGDGCLPDEELKGVMAVCTLLNARSARVKGLQLMISLILVARATGRQVYTCTYM